MFSSDGGLSSDAGLSFDPDDARHLRELAEFVAVPSVSRDAGPATMRAAAQWLAGQLDFARGRVVETGRHPPVPGERPGAPPAPAGPAYRPHPRPPTGPAAQSVAPPPAPVHPR